MDSPTTVAQNLMASPLETMETICAHVSNGGSLVDLCQTWGVRYSDMIRWVNSDDDRLKEYSRAIIDRSEWVKETILNEIKRIATTDIRQIFRPDGSVRPVDEWPDSIAMAVQSIETVEEFSGKGASREHIGWTKKIKLWNKEKAIELLGKHLQLFTDRHEIVVTRLEDLVGESMKHDAKQLQESANIGAEGSDSPNIDDGN